MTTETERRLTEMGAGRAFDCRGVKLPAWVLSLIARRPYKVAAVALANKMARTIWALLVKGGTYQAPTIMGRA